jgi:hypothetical protein
MSVQSDAHLAAKDISSTTDRAFPTATQSFLCSSSQVTPCGDRSCGTSALNARNDGREMIKKFWGLLRNEFLSRILWSPGTLPEVFI